MAIGYEATYSSSNEIALGTTDDHVEIKGDVKCYKNIDCHTLTFDNAGTLDFQLVSNFAGLTSNIQQEFDILRRDSGLAIVDKIGQQNVILGALNSSNLSTGSFNVVVGPNSFDNAVSNNNCITIGSSAGQNVKGDDNICIGTYTGCDPNTSGIFRNSVAIGSGVKITDNSQFHIGNNLHEVYITGKLNVNSAINCLSSPTLGTHLVSKSYVDVLNNIQNISIVQDRDLLNTTISNLNIAKSNLQSNLDIITAKLDLTISKQRVENFLSSNNNIQNVYYSTPFSSSSRDIHKTNYTKAPLGDV